MHGLFIGLGNLEDLLLLSKLVGSKFVHNFLLFLQEIDSINLEFELFVVFGDFIPKVKMQ